MRKIFFSLFVGLFLLLTSNVVFANSEITFGKVYTEVFTKENSKEYYSINFTLDEASEVSIQLSTSFTVNYSILLPNGDSLVSHSVKGKETNYYDLQPGEYTLSFSSWDAGKYSFEINIDPAKTDDIEPNNGTDEAQLLPFGTTKSGYIALNDYIDYYYFTVEEAGKVNLYIESFLDGDTYYSVITESNETIIGKGYSSSNANPAKINNELYLEPGTYYVAIYYKYGKYTGKYNITANFTPANNNDVEPNNGTAQAQSIEFGEIINGFLSWNDSNDVYVINVKNNSEITINLKAALTNDTYLRVRDDMDNVVFSDNYRSSIPNPAIIKESLSVKPGKYYVEVYYKYSDAYGNYDLYVTGDGITSFKDYKPEYWANSFVWGAKNTIINGDRKTNMLYPYRNITEAQWLAMLLRYAYDAKDSKSGNWYDSYYALAKQQGIPVNNKPNQPLRRGTVASMLVKVYTGQTLPERDAVQWLYDNEITTGVDPTKPKTYENFNPNGHMTRSQAITFMYRLYEKGITP